jgi:hypothetical protein
MEVGTIVKVGHGLEIQVTEWKDSLTTFSGVVVKTLNPMWNINEFSSSWSKHSVVKAVKMPEGKLKVFLKAAGNTVIFKVLEQDESLRGSLDGTLSYYAANGNVIKSAITPDIVEEFIYLRGDDTDCDYDVAHYHLNTDQEAREYVTKAKVALKEFAANNYFEGKKLEIPESVDEDIFWV